MEIDKSEILYMVKISSQELADIRRCITKVNDKNLFDDDKQKHRCREISTQIIIDTKEPAPIVIDR